MKKKPVPIHLSPDIAKIGSMVSGSLQSALSRIQNPKRIAAYFAMILLGLAASRFVNALIMYSLSSEIQSILPAGQMMGPAQKQTRPATQYDITSIIDGVFFKRAALESRGPESAVTPEIKNFSLIGTLEGDPSFARAVIRIVGDKDDPREYALGEKIGSAVLIAIGYEKIWIRLDGQKYKIEAGESVQDVQNKSTSSMANAENISKVLSRQEINEKILGNPAAIYGGGAAFGPNLVNGKIEGFKLHRVPENHIFHSLGARSGDIIKTVNGYTLSNTSQMMELWNNIKSMPRVSVDLIRDGKPMKFDFEIRN